MMRKATGDGLDKNEEMAAMNQESPQPDDADDAAWAKHGRFKDEKGRYMGNRYGESYTPKIGAKGPYRVADKENFDDTTRPTAGDYFDELFKSNIKISGLDENEKVQCFRTFEEMNLHESLLENLHRKKYERPLPVQQAAFPLITKNYDLIALAPPGHGKTGAFLIPIVDTILKFKTAHKITASNNHPYCIILSPVRELAEQLYRDASDLCNGTICRVVLSFGGIIIRETKQEIRNGCDIIVITVGRLCNFVEHDDLKLDDLKFIVFDEADKLLCDDERFVDQMKTLIIPKFPSASNVCKLFFSATDASQLEEFAKDIFKHSPIRLEVGDVNSFSALVEQDIIEVHQKDKHRVLLEMLSCRYHASDPTRSPPKTIIFVNTKRRCSVIACLLSLNHLKAYPVHGNLSLILRRQHLDVFEKGECHILVATDAMSRGMDFKDISHVINYDVPKPNHWASYVHRVGRTGRLGNRGLATTFYAPETDASMAIYLYEPLKQNNQTIPMFLQRDVAQQLNEEQLRQKIFAEYRKAIRGEYQQCSDSDEDDEETSDSN